MTRRYLVTVLYEDAPSGPPKTFGPHALVLACVADRGGADRWSLQDIAEPNARKSNSRVKTALENDAADLAAKGVLVAVYDDDRVRELYGLARETCPAAVVARVKQDVRADVDVRLLVRNTETLVDVAAKALGRTPVGKSPEERDRVLNAAAGAAPDVRRTILEKIPSFCRLVDVVAGRIEQVRALAAAQEIHGA